MLPCAPDTVYTVLSWIRSISCGSGRNLLAALSSGLTDPACHAIHLITANLPEHPEAVLTALPALAAGRPVNIFYLQASLHSDQNVKYYLQCLARATRGRCYVLPVGLNGELGEVVPLCVAESRPPVQTIPSVSCCCPAASVLPPQGATPLLRCIVGNPACPAASCTQSGQAQSPEFFPGCEVLARKEVDGFFYAGTVIQCVQGRGGVWVVGFDPSASTSAAGIFSQRELVCSLDMVKLSRGHTDCLVPGDAVLSPWEPDLRRYGPGRVTTAAEHRGGSGAAGVACLQVLMWNSRLSLVPGRLVSPIPDFHYDRIVRELQVSASPSGCCHIWLCAHNPCCTAQRYPSSCRQSPPHCCPAARPWSCSVLLSCGSSPGGRDGFESTEQDKAARKSEPEAPSSSSSSSLSEDETRATFPPAVKLRNTEQRPPWRYWKATGPEQQHRPPGRAGPKGTPKPARFIFPLPQIGDSPNHSSSFKSLPSARGRRRNKLT